MNRQLMGILTTFKLSDLLDCSDAHRCSQESACVVEVADCELELLDSVEVVLTFKL